MISIIQHENAIRVSDNDGDIYFPWKNWFSTGTADNWYTKVPDEYYKDKSFYPLVAVNQNPWRAMETLTVEPYSFKRSVEYTCPYNKYVHYWAIPILIFTEDIETWISKSRPQGYERYLDQDWVKRFYPLNTKNGFPFTKIHRALLGPGFCHKSGIDEGRGHIYDALVALDNGDFLGVKVWVWFNRKN